MDVSICPLPCPFTSLHRTRNVVEGSGRSQETPKRQQPENYFLTMSQEQKVFEAYCKP
jgi:hypothetical protein